MSENSNRFCTTHWTLVLNARDLHSPENQMAMEQLCRAYWYPLYFFVRRKGYSEHDAQDLVQGFYSKVLEKHYLALVERSKGRFRTFLLTALSSFLCNELDHRNALKRGGGVSVLSLDLPGAEDLYRLEPASPEPRPDEQFERTWAETVVERVANRLQSETTAAGQEERFQALMRSILGQTDSSYAELGEKLNLSEGGVKTAVRRLRQRFGELLREELLPTVSNAEEVDEEIRYLLRALRK